MSSAVLVFLAVTIPNWRFLRKSIPIWSSEFGNYVLHFSQGHPFLARVLHVILDAIPDAVPLFLGLAGLVYLMPDLAKRIEARKPLRVGVATLCILFSLLAIAVNAVNREDQEHKEADQKAEETVQGQNMGAVLKSVGGIQDALNPKAANMTEAKRREYRISALRDEYILTQNPVDPEIAAGNRMPPAVWMNQRLMQLGESWTVKDPPPPSGARISQLPPEEKKAKLSFSFFKPDMAPNNLKTVLLDPMNDGKISIRVAAIVVGDTPAENLQVWIRMCTKCEWLAPQPANLASLGPDFPSDRTTTMPELQPNVDSPIWNLAIQGPRFPKSDTVMIGCYYSCKNCDPVDWTRPQRLFVTRTMQAGFMLHSASISYTPEPVKQ
jgi:hypothetical protein